MDSHCWTKEFLAEFINSNNNNNDYSAPVMRLTRLGCSNTPRSASKSFEMVKTPNAVLAGRQVHSLSIYTSTPESPSTEWR